MKLKIKTTRQLSYALGFLGLISFIILGWGNFWGFSGLAQQIAGSIGVVTQGFNIYFLGQTHEKQSEEAKK
jgi:small neutral amino acid transporter SnatA (MarC family)